MAAPISASQDSPGRRCIRIKRDGEQCRKAPVNGSTVCASHGAAKGSPVRATADRKVVEEKLRKSLGSLVTDRRGLTALEAYQEALEATVGTKDAALQLLHDRDDLSPDELAVVQKLVGVEPAKVAKIGIDAGLAERSLALQEEQQKMLGEALGHAMQAVGLDADQQRVFLSALAERLA